MKALVLHAHPDDELLFAGALMLSRPTWEWQTVSLTGGLRKAQYPGISLDFDDPWRILTLAEFRQWRAAVEALDLHPDVVFTHNRLGEYGHPHHMSVHRIAHELYPRVWDFYVEAESSISPQDADWTTVVFATEAKRDLFIRTYGQKVLDELTVNNPGMIAEVFWREQFTGREIVP